MKWTAKSREELLREIRQLSKQLEVTTSLEKVPHILENDTVSSNFEMFDNLNMMCLTLEIDGTISYCNQFTVHTLGWQFHEILGQNFFELLVPKDEKEERWANFQKSFQRGGVFDNKVRAILTKTGSIRYMTFNSLILNNDGENVHSLTTIGEDVTEKRRIEQVLLKANSQLQDLVENTSDLIQIFSLRGKILFVNPTWKEILGYDDTDLINLNIRDIIHPDFLEDTLQQLDKIEKGAKNADFKTVFRKKNGRRIYLAGSVNCRIENDKPVAFRCILHDSTEKVRAERAQALYYSIANSVITSKNLNNFYQNIHEELGKIIDVKNFFIALYNPEKSYLYFPYYIDEAFDDQVRFTKRKLGNGLTEYAITANRPLFLTDTEIQSLADRKEIYLYGQVPKCMLCVPLRIGDRITGIIGLKSYERSNKYHIRDLELLEFISGQVALAIERKRNEEKLLKQSARLEAIFESSSHLMWSVNKRLLLTGFNQNYHDFVKELLNISPQIKLSPEKLAWRMVNPDERKILEDKYKLALKGEPQHLELNFFNPNTQRELWYDVYLNPIILEHNLIEEVSGIARDITDLKQSSQQLLEAKDEAERLLKVKESFLANMSHEIRTPMNGVIGMVDLLADTPLNNQQQKYVQTIKKSSETLLNILNDILDLSKIEAGKMALHETPIVVQDLLEKLISLFEQAAYKKGNKLIYIMTSDLPKYIIGDETRLLQIMSNLVSNAIKFTENGLVEVKLSKIIQHGRICKLKVEVTDTGVGIPGEQLKKLFNAFVQADSSYKKSVGGTGLGLTISKSLAQLMKGETGVSSKVGIGSNFWVTFEVKETSIAPVQKNESGDFKVLDFLKKYSPNILLVDDNAVNQTVAGEILRKAGCHITTADSGQRSLELVEQSFTPKQIPFDIILMDIQMPEMDGIETTQRLRKHHGTSLPPIVAMTAYSMKEDRDRFLNAGMDDYISKPIRAENICKKIRDWMEKTNILNKDYAISSVLQEVEPIEETIEIFDLEVLKQLSSMAGKEMVEQVYEEFMTEADIQITESLEAFKHQDYQTIKSHLHTLKGNAGTIGLSRLHETVKNLELKVKIDNFSSFESEMPLIIKDFEDCKQQWRTFLADI